MKTCTRCKAEKEESAFCKDRATKDGLHRWCTFCVVARSKERNKSMTHEERARRNAQQRERWKSMSPEQRAAALVYRQQYGKEHPEMNTLYYESLSAEKKQAYIKRVQGYAEANRERVRAYKRNYKQRNPHLVAEDLAYRRMVLAGATPPWADRREIRKFYALAKKRTKETGVKHEVDHIMPLRGNGCTGLHVPWNLQVIPATVNRSKHNKLLYTSAR